MHILLVDDDPENSIALAYVLKAEGHSVDIASDGYEALDTIRAKSFDAVVSDALMPRMDGFALCRTIRADEARRDLPIIILTGEYTDQDDEEFARRIGATKVLRKNGDADELLRTLGGLPVSSRTRSESNEGGLSLDEREYLKGYNSILFRKLEAKMTELENVNRRLLERNAELEHERRKYSQLFASANDGILIVDQETFQIAESNLHARKILQLSDKSIVQRKLDELKPFGELLVDKISRRESVQFETSFEFDGTKTLLDISGAPVGTDDKLYLIILRNVTRRKEWLERFISIDKLRALGRLSNGLVHEIRNPLNVISVNLQYLDRTLEEGSIEKKFTQSALAGVNAIEKVIRETMNFARPQTPTKSQFRLGPLLSEISGLSKTSFQRMKIHHTIERGESDDTVFADRSQVLHALLNIVENAIDAMPSGGKLVFRLEDSQDGEEAVLHVSDSGIGMDEEVAKAALEPFFTTKEASSGMGLSISNRLFELNDAHLAIESKTGSGTTVTIRFRRGDRA